MRYERLEQKISAAFQLSVFAEARCESSTFPGIQVLLAGRAQTGFSPATRIRITPIQKFRKEFHKLLLCIRFRADSRLEGADLPLPMAVGTCLGSPKLSS